jgi:hypothetical protein
VLVQPSLLLVSVCARLLNRLFPARLQALEKAQEGTKRAGGASVVAGAAAVGGVAAAALVGGVVLPVAAAGAAGYAATRSDGIGDAARATGNAAVSGLAAAKEFEQEHQVGAKVKTIGQGAVEKAKEVNEKYQVVDNVKVSFPFALPPENRCTDCTIAGTRAHHAHSAREPSKYSAVTVRNDGGELHWITRVPRQTAPRLYP